MSIPAMLTPFSGHVDPPPEVGKSDVKERWLKLGFFAQRIAFEFDSEG